MRILLIRQRMGLARVILLVAALAGVLAGVSFGQAPGAQGQPKAILLIRYAEKPESGMDLAPVGFERAKMLAKLFGGSGSSAQGDLPRPDFLFATHVSKNSNRPVETITPLSEALREPISHEILDKDFAALAVQLLCGKYAGKVVLVAWHHGSLPGLARALGLRRPTIRGRIRSSTGCGGSTMLAGRPR